MLLAANAQAARPVLVAASALVLARERESEGSPGLAAALHGQQRSGRGCPVGDGTEALGRAEG
jgi:hypothetical protein